MYPIQCYAGYYVPVKAGKFEIVGFEAVVNTLTSAATINFVDDEGIKPWDKFGRLLSSSQTLQPPILTDKTSASGGTLLGRQFAEPVKVRHGLSAMTTDNCIPGQIIVWVK